MVRCHQHIDVPQVAGNRERYVILLPDWTAVSRGRGFGVDQGGDRRIAALRALGNHERFAVVQFALGGGSSSACCGLSVAWRCRVERAGRSTWRR